MASSLDIKTIGVIGVGTMGSGIVSVSALNGYRVIAFDKFDSALQKAAVNISKGYTKILERGKITEDQKKSAEDNITYTSNFDELSGCGLVIEAALEDMQVKKDIYTRLDEICALDCIFASNTSSFSITSISTSVKTNPGRVIGMHFFNPANIMKLVEVIKGEFTAAETLETVIAVCGNLGKTPVICADTPAFIVNRVARAFYGEALKIMSEESLPPGLIDTVMKEEGGFAMGPFELMDLIGIDVNLSVTKSVYEAFFYDQKYKPSPVQQKMVEAGMLGRKTKRGFYTYK